MSLRVSTSSPLRSACSGLMYSGVPTNWRNSVNSVFSVSRWCVALAMPKSMIFGTGVVAVQRDEDVRRLEVAVDDPLLVGVLHRVADADEELEPLVGRELRPGRSTR